MESILLQRLQACGVDVAEGVSRFMDSEQLYAKYVVRFLEDQDMERLISAYRQQDVQTAFEAAHSLKALTGNLALTCLYEQLKPMVEILRGKNLPEETMINKLQDQYQQIIEILQEAS